MLSFSKSLDVPGKGIYTFRFARVYTVNGTKYFVMVHDRYGMAYQFSMQQTKEAWRLVDAAKLPIWIVSLEATLENAILEQLS